MSKKYAEMTVEELKEDIRSRPIYYVPHGFVNEGLDTKLHRAMRELVKEGAIEPNQEASNEWACAYTPPRTGPES